MKIFRNGKLVNEPKPKVEPRHHWHDWVECIRKRTPVVDAI